MRNGSSYIDYPEFRLGAAINLYFPPVIVSVGCVGNFLSFLIYIKRKYRNKVAPVYILSLSVIDSINLTVGLLHYWIMFNFYPDRIKPLHCRLMFFLVNAMANHSHWVVIAFTLDRFLAVWFPFWTRNNQSRTRAWIAITIIGVVAYAKNLHYLWTAEFIYQPTTRVASCGFGIRNKNQWVLDYQLFEITASSLIPFIIIVILNTSIVYRMHRDGNFSKAYRRHQSSTSKSQSVTTDDLGNLSKAQRIHPASTSKSQSVTTDDLGNLSKAHRRHQASTSKSHFVATRNSLLTTSKITTAFPTSKSQTITRDDKTGFPNHGASEDTNQTSLEPTLQNIYSDTCLQNKVATKDISVNRKQSYTSSPRISSHTIKPSDSIQQITDPPQNTKLRSYRMFHFGLTISLLLVSSAFVVLVSPLLVLRFYNINHDEHMTPHQRAIYAMKYQICQKLWYSNNAVNFFLYSLSGRSFRADLKSTLIGFYRRFFSKQEQLDKRSNSKATLDSTLTIDTANSVKEK